VLAFILKKHLNKKEAKALIICLYNFWERARIIITGSQNQYIKQANKH
jgi:hypothetical protein